MEQEYRPIAASGLQTYEIMLEFGVQAALILRRIMIPNPIELIVNPTVCMYLVSQEQ